MKKPNKSNPAARLKKEYDFSAGVRGKYAARFAAGTNLARIDPDLAERFPDSESVNRALRGLVDVAERTARAISG
jgi:hypothetical protein